MTEVCWSTEGLRIHCGERGFAASGDGFYVWDEQLSEVLEAARLIGRRGRLSSPS